MTKGELPTSPEFKAAAAAVKAFKVLPSSDDLLEFYGLFKTATKGKNTDPKPDGYFDFTAKAKWDAWTAKASLSPEKAQTDYIEYYESKKAKYEKTS